MCEIILDPERLKNLEVKPGDLERRLPQQQAKWRAEGKMQELEQAYKEGFEADGRAEAERRMRAKYYELKYPELARKPE
jgi:hypothetical protein